MWVGFVLFIDELGGAGAPFFLSVVALGHELEELEEKKVC